MAKKKSNKGIPNNNKPGMPNSKSIPVNTTNDLRSFDKTITAKEFLEYERLKKFKNESGELNIGAYRQELEKIVEEEVEQTKITVLEEINTMQINAQRKIKENEALLKEEWAEKNKKIVNIVEELEKQKEALEKVVNGLSTRRDTLEEEIHSQIASAQKNALEIVEKAKLDAKNVLKQQENEIVQRAEELDKLEQKLSDEQEDIERQSRRLKEFKIRLEQKEEIFAVANPEKLKALENEVDLKKEYIDELLENYSKLQKKLDEETLIKLKLGSKTPTEVIKENEQLLVMVEELRNKCNLFTDIEIMEMQRALDEKPTYESEVQRLKLLIRDNNSELMRLENADRELENIRSRVELIKTLNDHLKQELLIAKQTLESRAGEACPKLTEVDIEESKPEPIKVYNERKSMAKKNSNVSLVDIVTHVKMFAASQEVPLYYKDSDLRAFVAGLASSHLSILQGLSGTGKTSLPDVFAKAIFSENKVVSVESSWRDRNELLGYYNDFNKKFTAKDFTCHLYRAGLENYSDTVYFIVLDEMNLSRVEYYFADFLSILENPDSNEWKVPLVDVDLRCLPLEINNETINELTSGDDLSIAELVSKIYEKGKITKAPIDDVEKRKLIDGLSHYMSKKDSSFANLVAGPRNLQNGNTLMIPKNVWFIGTANRDESTFEITDKVYDRAQVLNFTKASPEPIKDYIHDPLHVSNAIIVSLFNNAKRKYNFEYDKSQVIKEIDIYLEKEFKVSFGNRIGNQMNDFVRVYMACGEGLKSENELKTEAIDYQIANKVIRKLEHKDTTKVEKFKDLRDIFEMNNLKMCKKIIDDKIENEG